MSLRRHTPEQIVRKLREAEVGLAKRLKELVAEQALVEDTPALRR